MEPFLKHIKTNPINNCLISIILHNAIYCLILAQAAFNIFIFKQLSAIHSCKMMRPSNDINLIN